ncbi:MAG TPA: hypothetical protein VMT99_02380 [Candidatus Paceibacterota bacterium]|nr:hypothetical protein [Candidatus Paceibacterota bacterium]
MNKKTVTLVILVVAALGVGIYAGTKTSPASPAASGAAFDPRNATYVIDGAPVTLADGSSSQPAAPGSASMVLTSVFESSSPADLDGNGTPDAAVILVRSSGGSGTFYYVAAALDVNSSTVGTNAVLLGDRIAPQTLEIKNGQIVVNYADRAPGDPMTATPSVGVTKYFGVLQTDLQQVSPIAGPGEACGGNLVDAPVCGKGYHCAPTAPARPGIFGDVGGKCVAD